MALSSGTRLGPYEIVAAIGAGGMGEVYRARDIRLDRDVAIKVLPEPVSGDADRRARFEREAKAVAALSHPNILAIFDVGESSGVVYAAMELLEGETLRDRLRSGPLLARKTIEYGVQIARGLSAAHDRGIIHRDLKPENLFLVGDGQIKILDFGIAKALTSEDDATRTQMAATDPAAILGTVGYMAPEQARGLPLDARADLFSLGAVLYEMATGQRAFQRDTAADTISAILREDPPEPSGTRTDFTPALDRIIRHALEKEPNERFQTARDIAFALGSLSGSASGPSVPVAREVAPGRARWRRWLIPAAFAILAAAGGIAVGMQLAPTTAPVTYTRKTFQPQAIFSGRFMPDGQTIVFSSALSGNSPGLFELRPDAPVPRPFGPPATHLLSISKSGEMAVLTGARFLGHRLFSGTLARMTLDGSPRPVATGVREADWLPDGTDVAVVREVPGGDQLEFPIGHVVLRTSGYFSDLRVSPDGTRLAFMDHIVKFDDRGWVKVVDRAGVVTTLGGNYNEEEGLAWSADGKTVFFATTRIWSVPASGGGRPKPVAISAGTLRLFDVAPDGRMLAIRDDNSLNVIARGVGHASERQLSTRHNEWGPSLSPDGRIAVFTQGGGRDYSVLVRNTDGSPPARLGDGTAIAFSPDQRWVTATLLTTGKCVVYPTGTGAPVAIPMGPLESCTSVGWFPDGKNLIIIGNEPGKTQRTYRAAFPNGAPQPLLPEGLMTQEFDTVGRCLLATDGSGNRWKFDLTGPTTPVAGLLRTDTIVGCDIGLRWVMVSDNSVIPAVIARVDLASGQRTRIADVAPADRVGLLSVRVSAYREDGAYAYQATRGVSTLFVVTRPQ